MKSSTIRYQREHMPTRFQVLEKIFHQIGEEQKHLILLQCCGLSFEDMAESLGIPESTLVQRLSLAKKQARDLIKQHYG